MQYSFWSIPKYLPAQNILEPVEGQGINFELFSFIMSIEACLTPFLKQKAKNHMTQLIIQESDKMSLFCSTIVQIRIISDSSLLLR